MKGSPVDLGWPVDEYADVAEYLSGVPPRRLFLWSSFGGYMIQSNSSMAQQIAQAAVVFEQRRTGHTPKSVTAVMSENTLMITLHGALSPAEKALAQSPAGAAQMQDFHRQLFTNAADSLRQEIKRITGVEVREATAEVEPTTGTVVQAFTSGTVVQVFLLARGVPSETWSEVGLPDLA
jgi:uncharacterized protein YbcI